MKNLYHKLFTLLAMLTVTIHTSQNYLSRHASLATQQPYASSKSLADVTAQLTIQNNPSIRDLIEEENAIADEFYKLCNKNPYKLSIQNIREISDEEIRNQVINLLNRMRKLNKQQLASIIKAQRQPPSTDFLRSISPTYEPKRRLQRRTIKSKTPVPNLSTTNGVIQNQGIPAST